MQNLQRNTICSSYTRKCGSGGGFEWRLSIFSFEKVIEVSWRWDRNIYKVLTKRIFPHFDHKIYYNTNSVSNEHISIFPSMSSQQNCVANEKWKENNMKFILWNNFTWKFPRKKAPFTSVKCMAPQEKRWNDSQVFRQTTKGQNRFSNRMCCGMEHTCVLWLSHTQWANAMRVACIAYFFIAADLQPMWNIKPVHCSLSEEKRMANVNRVNDQKGMKEKNYGFSWADQVLCTRIHPFVLAFIDRHQCAPRRFDPIRLFRLCVSMSRWIILA